MTVEYRDRFLREAMGWVGDDWMVSFSHISRRVGDQNMVWDSILIFSPIPVANTEQFEFSFSCDALSAGQTSRLAVSKAYCEELLNAAIEGNLQFEGPNFKLSRPEHGFGYHAAPPDQNTWSFALELEVFGGPVPQLSASDAGYIDSCLRTSAPPFDGMLDLHRWLNLTGYRDQGRLRIRVAAPADLSLGDSSFKNGKLNASIIARVGFEASRITLSARGDPGRGILDRALLPIPRRWRKWSTKGVVIGNITRAFPDCDTVLVMLSVGSTIVRRHFFADPARGRNLRLLAMQHFDRDLKMLREALFNSTDSQRFENATVALAYLLGFSQGPSLERDAPDILVSSPGGSIILIEATLRTSDFANKLGKLVDRRASLQRALTEAKHYVQLQAVLVCGVGKDQLGSVANDAIERQVLLVTRDDINQAMLSLRHPIDPDARLAEAVTRMRAALGTPRSETFRIS